MCAFYWRLEREEESGKNEIRVRWSKQSNKIYGAVKMSASDSNGLMSNNCIRKYSLPQCIQKFIHLAADCGHCKMVLMSENLIWGFSSFLDAIPTSVKFAECSAEATHSLLLSSAIPNPMPRPWRFWRFESTQKAKLNAIEFAISTLPFPILSVPYHDIPGAGHCLFAICIQSAKRHELCRRNAWSCNQHAYEPYGSKTKL